MRKLNVAWLFFELLFLGTNAQTLPQAHLALWLRADSGVVRSGSNVTQWNDVSGNNNIFNPGGTQPLIVDSIPLLDLHPVVRFNGTTDKFTSTNPTTIGSVFVIANWRAGNTFPNYNGLVNKATNGSPPYLFIGNLGTSNIYPGGTLFNGNVFMNSVQGLNAAPLSTYKVISGIANSVSSPYDLVIGNNPFDVGNNYWNGDIAEIIMFDTILSTPVRLQVEQYLYQKYAPPVEIGSNVSVPGVCDTTLNAGAGFVSYQWNGNPSDTNPVFVVSRPGKYFVETIDIFGFHSTDTVTVTYPLQELLPNELVCSNDTLTWNSGLTHFYKFLWSDHSTDSLLHIVSAGSYYVTVTDTVRGCTFYSDTTQVTIDNFSLIASLGSDTLVTCSGNSIGLVTGADRAASYTWSDNSHNPTLVVMTQGMYRLTVIDSSGCQAMDSVFVVISGNAPVVNFSASTVCFGQPMQFTDLSTPFSVSDTIVSWLWNFGGGANDTSSFQNPSHVFADTLTHLVTLTAYTNGGCFNSVSKNVNVHPNPVADFTASLSCTGNSTQFTNQSNFFGDSASAWFWNFGDPASLGNNTSILKSPAHSFNSVADYFVKLVITSIAGCKDSIQKTVHVNPSTFCFTPNQIPGLRVWLNGSHVVLNGSQISQWTDISGNNNHFTQSNPANQPLYVPSTALIGYYPSVRLDGTNDELTSSALTNIGSVFILSDWSGGTNFPNYNGLINKATSGSPSYILTGNSSTANFFGGPSTLFDNNVFINSNSGLNYSPLKDYKVVSGLTGTMASNYDLVIGNNPFDFGNNHWNGDIAEIIIYDSILNSAQRIQVEQYLYRKYAPPVNLGPDVNMTTLCDTMLDASPRFTSYQWHVGNSPSVVDTNQTLLVSLPGKYWVEAKDIFGFVSTDTVYVTYPLYLPSATNLICLGDTLHWNTGLNLSNYSFLWNDNSTNASLDLIQPGQYFVSITENSTGCIFHSDTIHLSVDSFPVLASLGSDSVSLCLGNTIGLTQGAAQAANYSWSTGATTAIIPVLVTGNYSLNVQDINGCSKSDSIYATIIGIPPVANFSATSVCKGIATQFTDSSYDPTVGNSIQSWLWNFGDGSTDTLTNPSHVFVASGNHFVTLTVTSSIGCPNSATRLVIVHPLPVASFVNSNACNGSSVLFNSTSTIDPPSTITNYLWNFGNPASGTANNTSILQNPSHLFDTTVSFVVKLVTTSDFGCQDSAFHVVTVLPASHADFQYLPTCYGKLVQFTNLSQPPLLDTAWFWAFGDNQFNQLESPLHYYSSPGNYIVTLTVYASTGCISVVTKPVTVSPIPNAAFVHSPACIGAPYQFIDSSYISTGNIVGWNWNFAGLDSSIQQNPVFTFQNLGTDTIRLTVTSDIGCTNTIRQVVTVHPLPVANFSFYPQFGPPPLNVTFSNVSTGSNSYSWNFGDNSPPDLSVNPQHLYTDTNRYTIQLVAISQFGCKDTIEKSIYVIKPILDLALTSISSEIVNNRLQITVGIANLGTRTIDNFKIQAQLEGGTRIQESYVQTLPNGYSGQLTLFTSLDLGAGLANYFCVSAIEPNGQTDDVASNNELCRSLTKEFSVVDPYPNPFNDLLTLQMILPYKDNISIELFDVNGKSVGIYNGTGNEGLNQFEFDLGGLANGIYAIRFNFRETDVIKKLVKIERKK